MLERVGARIDLRERVTRPGRRSDNSVPPAAPRGPSRSTRLEAAAVVVLLAVAVAARVPSLDRPLLDGHGFRQTQTAYTALMFHEDGIDLLHSKLPLFGPPWEVPFEFPLFQAVASVPMAFGMPSDMACKVTNLGFFLLTALLLYGLVRQLAGRTAALCTFVFFLFMPFAMLWSRAAMIEFLVTAACVGFLWAGINWRLTRHPGLAAAALAAGVAAWLVKPTTALFWPVLLVLFTPDGERGRPWGEWIRNRLDPVLMALVVVPVGAALWWTRHADAIKEASPATRWLTSRALASWVVSPWEQRTHASNWGVIAERAENLVLGIPVWLVPVLLLLVWRTGHRWFYAALAGSALLTVAVFFNLHLAHDYYLSAVTPQIAVVVGVAASVLLDRLRRPAPRAAGAAIMAAALLAFVVSARSYYGLMYTIPRTIAISQLSELRADTAPGDNLLFVGFDWSPEVPYYSHRRGLMLREDLVTPSMIPGFGVNLFTGAVMQDFDGFVAEALSYYRWIGTRSPHVYSLGASFDALGSPPIASTTDRGSPAGAAVLSDGPQVLPCDGATLDVPAPRHAAWLRFDGRAGQGIVVAGTDAAPLPADRVAVVAASALPAAPLTLRCVGGGTVTLVEALDAPLPRP